MTFGAPPRELSELSLSTKPEARPIWALLLGIVIMCVLMVLEAPAALNQAGPALTAAADFHDTVVYYARLAGWVSVPAFIIWAITYVAFMRRNGPSWSYLLVLIVIGVACTFAMAHRLAKEDQVAAIVDNLATALAADDDVNDSEIEKLGIVGVAEPERLPNAAAAAIAHSKISEARRVIDKHHDLTTSRLLTARSELQLLQPKWDAMRTEQQEVLSRIRNGRAMRDNEWRRQHAMLDELDGSVTLLDKTRGSWRQGSGRKILFTDSAAMAAYRRHIEKLRNLLADADAAKRDPSIEGSPTRH